MNYSGFIKTSVVLTAPLKVELASPCTLKVVPFHRSPH